MEKRFASGELERSTVVKEILTTAQSGAKGRFGTYRLLAHSVLKGIHGLVIGMGGLVF